MKLVDHIEDKDWKDAIEYIDPQAREEKGSQIVTAQLKLGSPVFRMIENRRGTKLSVGSVDVNDEDTEAKVTPRVWLNNRWHDMNPNQWVKVEGDWFMKIGATQDNNNQNMGSQNNSQFGTQDPSVLKRRHNKFKNRRR